MKKQSLKLNLGCGRDHRKGWVNIDAIPEFHPEVVLDLLDPWPFENDSTSKILAQDILEHFTKEQLQTHILPEISRVLRAGGTITVRVPNIDDIIARFSDDEDTRNQFLYGTTSQTGIFGAHKVGLSQISLVALFLQHNMKLESLKVEQTNLVASFKKVRPRILPRKILYFNQSFALGGAEVFMRDLIGELRSEGIKTSVWTTSTQVVKLFSQKRTRSKMVNFIFDLVGDWKGLVKSTIGLPKTLRAIWHLAKEIRKHDLLLLSGFNEKILLSTVAKVLGVPVVWIEFGPLQPVLDKFFGMPKVLYYLVKHIPELVIVPSEHSQRALISQAHLSLSKMRVIPCGTDSSSLKQQAKKVSRRNKHQLVCISRFEPGKGQDILIEAMSKLVKRIQELKLDIIGSGETHDLLRSLVSIHQLEDAVQIHTNVPSVAPFLRKASVAVFPSIWSMEGFGLVMTEAMSLGIPVVAFRTAAAPEILNFGEAGVLVEPGNVAALAEALENLLKDSALRKKLAKKALERFHENYDISLISKKYAKALAEAHCLFQANKQLGTLK